MLKRSSSNSVRMTTESLTKVAPVQSLCLLSRTCATLQMLGTQELSYQGKILLELIDFREEGRKIFPLSRDHKPSDEMERKRIIEAGG